MIAEVERRFGACEGRTGKGITVEIKSGFDISVHGEPEKINALLTRPQPDTGGTKGAETSRGSATL